jgi:hypothetical protein
MSDVDTYIHGGETVPDSTGVLYAVSAQTWPESGGGGGGGGGGSMSGVILISSLMHAASIAKASNAMFFRCFIAGNFTPLNYHHADMWKMIKVTTAIVQKPTILHVF